MAEAEALAQDLITGGSAGQRARLVEIIECVTVAEDVIAVRVKRQKQPACTEIGLTADACQLIN